MKKFLKLLVIFFGLFLFVGALASCDSLGETKTPEVTPTVEVETDQRKEIYNLAVSSGYTGTYEEWLNSIKGAAVELSVENGYLCWRYKGELTWHNLLNLSTLKGSNGLPGQPGPQGKPGNDGLTPEFRVHNGVLQYKFSNGGWTDLYEMPKGEVSGGNDSSVTPDEPSKEETITVTFVTEFEQGDYEIIPLEYEVVEVPKGNIEEPTFTKEGYHVACWYFYDKYEEEYTVWKFDYYSAGSNLTLYAIWEENEPVYTVSFKDQDGNIIESQEVEYGDIVKCPKVEAPEGYCAKWYIEGYSNSLSETFKYNYEQNLDIIYKIKPIGDNSYDIAQSFDTETPVTVTFWHSMGGALQNSMEEEIAAFKELYPNITINHELIGSYDDLRYRINSAAGSGNYPSMAYCYPEHVASYNKSNITVSLDDIIENEQYGFAGTQVKFAGPQQEDFVSGFWAEGCQYEDGKTYTVPFLKSTESLFYNKTFFEEHNLTVPTTWEEMWETCARIKEIDPSSIPLGYDAEANLFITLAETYGYDYTKAEGDYFYFNNEGMRGLMKQFKEYFDKGYFTTGQVSGYYYTSSAFASKTMYMSIGSSAGARYQVSNDGSFETGIASIPKAAGKKQACVSQGPSLVFFRRNNSQEVIASWLFTQYLLRPEAQAKFSFVTGYLPVTKTAMETSYYQEFLSRAYNEDGTLNDINAATSLKAVENYDYYYSSAVFVGSAAARDIVDNLVINILGDRNMTVDNMDTKIKEYFDAAIKECKDQVGL